MTYTCTLNSGVFQWYFSVSVTADVSRNSLSSHVSDGRTRSVRQSHASAFPCVRQTLRQTRSQSWDSFLRHYIYSGIIPRILREQSQIITSQGNFHAATACGKRKIPTLLDLQTHLRLAADNRTQSCKQLRRRTFI